ncbi:MAG: hypothetical protein WBD40_06275 [Tepidisphaeraceae bacterium]
MHDEQQSHDDQHDDDGRHLDSHGTDPTFDVEVQQVHASTYVSEQDLAMYAAITGRRPVVEIVRERPAMSIGYVVNEAPRGLRGLLSSARNHQKVTVWIRGMSIQARKKFDEAKMRLAS